MSLTIVKAGVLDIIQDEGRFGFQASGINPGGVMDTFSARLANCLLGKPMNAPLLEIHFPAPVIAFSEAAVICITGADFTAVVNDHVIPHGQPVLVNKGVTVAFKKVKHGARCYLSVFNNFTIKTWLNSYSTNLKASAGGLHGAALKSGDTIPFEKIEALDNWVKNKAYTVLPWKVHLLKQTGLPTIEVVEANEWNWLTETSKQTFLNDNFTITRVADRMGYRLAGNLLHLKEQKQLVSSGVSFGTIQLLPSGQLIVLMADHQTTGGYPRVANVISAHLPLLAQQKPGDTISFAFTDIETAEQKLLEQYTYLQRVQHAANLKMEKYIQ